MAAATFVVLFKSPLWVLVASLVAFAITTAYHVAKWLTFRLSVDPDELHTSHVFVTKTDRRIPIASIHDIHFEQSLLQRVFRVVTVRIETAGGAGTEAELSGLLRSQADALKHAIDEARRSGPRPEAPAPEPPEAVVVRLGARDLVLAGISSATIWVVAGAIASAWFFLDDLIPGLEERLAPFARSVAGFISAAGVLTLAGGVLALVVTLILTAAAISVARTFVRFWGFRVTSNGSRLLRSCGLVTTRRQVLALVRIQRILIRQRLLQKWMGCVSIELGTAALGSRNDEEKGRSFVIPIVGSGQVQPILDLLAPGAAALDGEFDPVSPLAGRRYLLRSALLFASISGGLAFWNPLVAGLVWVLFVRNLFRAPRLAAVGGSRATPDLIQFRTGAFSRRLATVPLRRVQGLVFSQTFFDRRVDLARLAVSGAGGGNIAALRDIPAATARRLVDVAVTGAAQDDAAVPREAETGPR